MTNDKWTKGRDEPKLEGVDPIKVSKPYTDIREQTLIGSVLKSGIFNEGPFVKIFEKWLEHYLDMNHEILDDEIDAGGTTGSLLEFDPQKHEGSKCVATNSGTSALHLALLTSGIVPGDVVVTTPLSFFATIEAIMHCGAKPAFADVNKWGVQDPEDTRKVIESLIKQGKKPKAILPVHMLGVPCDMDKFMDISEEYQIPIIEDAAQAHGGQYKNKMLGTWGECGCFSFFATKSITTIEGGLIYNNDPWKAHGQSLLRNHGLTPVNGSEHLLVGYNYRMNEVQAAMGCAQMMKYRLLIDYKITRTNRLMLRLKNIGGPIEVWSDLLDQPSVYRPAWWWAPVILPTKEAAQDLMMFMRKRKIGTRYRYTEPLYHQKCIAEEYKGLNLSMAEILSGRIVGLPNHPGVTEEQYERIVEAVEDWAR